MSRSAQQDDEEPDSEPTPLIEDPVQQGNCNAYEFVVFHEDLGLCCVIEDRMYPLRDFQRGPMCKPRIEIQAMAALKAREADYAPETLQSTIQSCGMKIALG